jgi:hypothetical protein
VLLLGVVFVGAGRLRWIGDDDDDASDDTIVFAVDKGNGNVFAYFSLEQAERRMSVFSVEDGEFDLYTDDGTVLSGQVEAGMNVFAGTDERRPDELRAALDAFVQHREIPVDGDDEDPMAAYAVAIADWQWLELWPAWMRPLARLLPMRRGG